MTQQIVAKPKLESGANGCVFWPPPPTHEHDSKFEGNKEFLVKFVLYQEPTEQQFQEQKIKKQIRGEYTRFAKQAHKEVRVGGILREIDPTARYLAGIWDSYPTLDLTDPLVQSRCGKIGTFELFPENFRAFVLPFRGTPLGDTLDMYVKNKKQFDWKRTWGPVLQDMAKSVELLHSHDLAHLDIHEQNYLISKSQDTDIYQATLIDFDRMVSSQEPKLEQKLLDIANEQIESLYGWYKDPQDRYAFEFNLARLPPEVVHFSNVQQYRFSSLQGPAILLKLQRRILTDFLVNANLITDLQADKIESAWKKLEALSLPLTMQEEREFVFAMDIFALGSLWLKIMCKTNGLLTNLPIQNRNKLLSFIITKMLHPDPVLRATIDECLEMIKDIL